MSRADIWMPLYIGDYLADTMHLEAREHGAYLLLIMHYWRNGPLPDDDRALAGIARVDRQLWISDTGPIVREFFEAIDGKLRHKRIETEREAARQIADKKRAAAEVRWGKGKPPRTSTSDADATPCANAPDDAYASPVDSRCTSPYARALPSPSQKEAKPRELERERAPTMPCRSDPPGRWLHLSETREVDGTGTTHAVINGFSMSTTAEMVCEAAGINEANWRGDWRPMIGWLQDGLDPWEQIVPAIRRVAQRPSYRPPASLAYFDKAVRESPPRVRPS